MKQVSGRCITSCKTVLGERLSTFVVRAEWNYQVRSHRGLAAFTLLLLMTRLPESTCLWNLQGVPGWEGLRTGWSARLHFKRSRPTRGIFWKKHRAASVRRKSQKQRELWESTKKKCGDEGIPLPPSALPAGQRCVCGAKALALLLTGQH